MKTTLRVLAVAALACLGIPAALAQGFPNRPITLICPWPAGGSTDTHLRKLADLAGKHLGQPVIVENKPGFGGNLGPSAMAASARPDGYTISQLTISAFRLPHMQKVDWDPLRDYTYIIGAPIFDNRGRCIGCVTLDAGAVLAEEAGRGVAHRGAVRRHFRGVVGRVEAR